MLFLNFLLDKVKCKYLLVYSHSRALLNISMSITSELISIMLYTLRLLLTRTSKQTFLFMVQSMVEMSTGIKIMPVNADRVINGNHGLHNAELDKWVQFKFTEISEPLAQVWTGIPFQFMKRLEDLNEGRPVRNYALRQLAEAILENNPEFNPNLDYVYICTEE